MTIKNPGAVEAAHGASETDELGRHVASENSLLADLTQAWVCKVPAQRSDASVHRANLDGAGDNATNAKPVAKKSQAGVLQIVIQPTRTGRKWIARLGDRVLCVSATPFIKSGCLLLAQGYPPDAVIEMWRPNTTEWALRGRLGAVAATVIDGETAPRCAKNGAASRFPGKAATTSPAGDGS
jgi:hypothetical protein